jgi:hypothetical protein
MAVKAARHRQQDPVREADALLGRERWDSARAGLFEGSTATVLVSPRRGAAAGAADVWVTLLVTSGRATSLGDVAVTLRGPGEARYGRLDARGRCLVRDVPDASYRLGLCRVAALARADEAATLPLPADRLGDCPRWTSCDGGVTATRLSEDWQDVRLDAAAPESWPITVGRVVDGRLELRSVRPDAGGSSEPAATLRFACVGPPDVVCLPLARR